MKVYLLTDIEGLGAEGEVKEVSDGFARNFLIRKGLASVASPSIEKHIKDLEKDKIKKEERLLKFAEKEAAELNGKAFEFYEHSRDSGEIYGSVRKEQIEEKIISAINPKSRFEVKLVEPIKNLGEHSVEVIFMGKFKSIVKIVVKPLEQKTKKNK